MAISGSIRNDSVTQLLTVSSALDQPLYSARVCRRTLDLAQAVGERGNPALASDAGVAALFAEAALRASAINVRVNLVRVRSQQTVERVETELNALLAGTPSLKEEILATVGRRMAGE